MAACLLVGLVLIVVPSRATNINCTSVKGPWSGTGDYAYSSAQCPSYRPYTLISCGMEAASDTESNYAGSWVSNDGLTCYAQNSVYADGVYAHAQCCDLSEYDISCAQYQSEWSGLSNYDEATGQCPNNTVLMGCSVSTEWVGFDGCYPGSSIETSAGSHPTHNQCTAANNYVGNGNRVRARLSCCNSTDYEFQCIQQVSEASGFRNGDLATVECPDQYFMASCSGVGHPINWGNMNQFSIVDNVCITRNRGISNYDISVYSMAICCRLQIVTLAPTAPSLDPTMNPTMQPTVLPTNYPTLPTEIPTTAIPTEETSNPTYDPTAMPTLNPTTMPTLYPTAMPTLYPTTMPTTYPTQQTMESMEPNAAIRHCVYIVFIVIHIHICLIFYNS